MYNEIIYLVSKTSVTNEVGDRVEVEERKIRFAQLKSIGQSEFYQAQAQGLKPELKFVMSDYLDYDNEQELIHNGFRYKVLRTYRQANELEIVVYGGVRQEVAQ